MKNIICYLAFTLVSGFFLILCGIYCIKNEVNYEILFGILAIWWIILAKNEGDQIK